MDTVAIMSGGSDESTKWKNPIFVEDAFAKETYRYNENDPIIPGKNIL
jgi:hypothetical protein